MEPTGQYTRANIVAGDFNSDGIGDIRIISEDFPTGTADLSLYLSEPTYAVFPPSINFGSVIAEETSAPIRVAPANVGNGNLSLSSITVSLDFVEQNNCSKKLTVEKNGAIEVQFRPQRCA